MRKSTPLYDVFDEADVELVRRDLRIDPHLIKKFRHRFLRNHGGDDFSLEVFPDELRHRFDGLLQFHTLELADRIDSKVDGATKLLFRTASGKTVESVILRAGTGRSTLCLSTQVGCAAACTFCATGYMGMAVNLSPSEILDQVVQAGELLAKEGRRLRNLVFMGMGEPFHNQESLHLAIGQLVSARHFDWPASRIMVSTVGIPDTMLVFARRFPSVHLAISLHAATQRTRARLIPLARRYPLDQVWNTIRDVNEVQGHPMMIEYLMLEGINDTASDASFLIHFLAGLNVHVNLIPYNPTQDAPELTSSPRKVRDRFAKRLREAGYVTTIRHSLGTDIEAACGQLVRKENRAKPTSGGRASGN